VSDDRLCAVVATVVEGRRAVQLGSCVPSTVDDEVVRQFSACGANSPAERFEAAVKALDEKYKAEIERHLARLSAEPVPPLASGAERWMAGSQCELEVSHRDAWRFRMGLEPICFWVDEGKLRKKEVLTCIAEALKEAFDVSE
jgi:hypothetical protein